jgi:hypothetical protein
VTRLASTLPEVEMLAVVPDAGSVPVISAPTGAPPAPVSWILDRRQGWPRGSPG